MLVDNVTDNDTFLPILQLAAYLKENRGSTDIWIEEHRFFVSKTVDVIIVLKAELKSTKRTLA